MSQPLRSYYRRCFISAPFGLELGSLTDLLAERAISWQWAKDANLDTQDPSAGITASDFALIVLNGTRADYRGTFDAGVAVGLGKPVLLIQTRSRPLPLDYRRFTTVKVSLSDRDALAFHLDLFLASPPFVPSAERTTPPRELPPSHGKRRAPGVFETDLERRAYDAVVTAGGTATAEPRLDPEAKFRPDLIAWLGHLDADLLDPTVIEVRHHADSKTMSRLEERLLTFMEGARVRTALVLTSTPAPRRQQRASPNILWLTIDEFEALARSATLGEFVRQARNRIVHGAQ